MMASTTVLSLLEFLDAFGATIFDPPKVVATLEKTLNIRERPFE
jgi:hypothetical protein